MEQDYKIINQEKNKIMLIIVISTLAIAFIIPVMFHLIISIRIKHKNNVGNIFSLSRKERELFRKFTFKSFIKFLTFAYSLCQLALFFIAECNKFELEYSYISTNLNTFFYSFSGRACFTVLTFKWNIDRYGSHFNATKSLIVNEKSKLDLDEKFVTSNDLINPFN